MRLIDADRLETILSETVMIIIRNPKMDNQEAHVRAAFDTFGKMLHNAPIIDAVPVVRCKDCQNWERLLFDADSGCYCPFVDRYTTDDWYCADGERRDYE